MKQTIRRALALFMVLTILISAGGALAALPELPAQTGVPVQTEQPPVQTEESPSHAAAVREILLASTVAKPKADKAAGTYTSTFKVKLTTTTKSAKIYFTNDGTKPTAKSKRYTKALTVNKNYTIKAVAIKDGKSSSVLTLAYKVRAATPKVNKTAGKYPDSVSVKLTSDTSGAKIYYTTDGSTPTKKSKLYSTAIKISKTTTIKALTVKSGMTNSKVVTSKYTIFEKTYTSRAGYLACNSDEKKVYKAIYNGLVKRAERIEMPALIEVTAALRVFERVTFDNPELIVWGRNVEYIDDDDEIYMETIFPVYILSKSKYTSMQKELKTAAEKVAAKARKGKTAAEQVKIIHDELILKATYDHEAANGLDNDVYIQNAFSAYGVLVDNLGVCESYSRAFQYVCQFLDIPVMLVCGDAGGGHMWNLVQVDSVWYHIDLTWDDPDDGESDYIEYDYFLISTAKMLEERTLDPVATGNQTMGDFCNFHPIPEAPKNFDIDSLLDAA